MNAYLSALTAVPGLALGSFITVVVARVPHKQSIVRPRSACRSCGAEISWHDNVPLVSYLLLRGRCRACRAPIGRLYPALELLTALLVIACVLVFGPTAYAAIAAFFVVVLLAVAAIDFQHRIVPNRIILPAAAILLLVQIVREPSIRWIVGGLAAFTFFFVAALAYPSGMGMGDVKLALFLGVGLGGSVAVALLIGMAAALVPSVILFSRHGVRARKMGFPFAPFLALGGIVALFFGHTILDWYFALR
jgi:leader peptidase (prepilin peptidase) / N-methyltransferase